MLLQNASADQAKQRAEELSRKKEATQTDLEKAKQEADKFAGLAQDARAEAEKKMQALSLDSSQLDQVRPHLRTSTAPASCCTSSGHAVHVVSLTCRLGLLLSSSVRG